MPLRATWDAEEQISLFSRHAEAVDLVLFDVQGSETARYALSERTDLHWHGYVYGIGPGQLYGFRVRGAFQPWAGQRFNPHKLLLDPYARAVHGSVQWGTELFGYDWQAGDDVANTLDSSPCAPKSVVIDPYFPWGDDRQPRIHWSDTVIYEIHARGFTRRHPPIPPALRGTYAGLAHPAAIRHLLDLGVTTVELMPVQQFIDQMYLVERGLRTIGATIRSPTSRPRVATPPPLT